MDNTETVTLALTPEQADALRPLINDPNRMQMLVNFIDNMLAVRRIAKIIAWLFGLIIAGLTAWFYLISIFKSPHGAP